MAKSKITVRSFVLCPEGPRPVNSLSPSERTGWLGRMSERLSAEMSDYFYANKEEMEEALKCTRS